jgi:hypothetical protein
MTEVEQNGGEVPLQKSADELDVRLWFVELKISETGLKKLATHEVKDREALLCMSERDKDSIKLAAGDRGKLECGIESLKASDVRQKTLADGSSNIDKPGVNVLTGEAPGGENIQGASGGLPQGPQGPGPQGPVTSQGATGVQFLNTEPITVENSAVGTEQKFGLSEVANFLTGAQIPPNFQPQVQSPSWNQPIQAQQPSWNLPLPQPPSWNFPGHITTQGYQQYGHPVPVPSTSYQHPSGLSQLYGNYQPAVSQNFPQYLGQVT